LLTPPAARFTKVKIFAIVTTEGKMPIKIPVKKTAWTKSPQTVKKPAKKTTQADIEANFVRIQKSQDQAWKAIKETQQAVKETRKNIGGFNNTLGSIVEHLLTPGFPQKIKKLGNSFNRIATCKFAEGVYTQIDGMLENGEQAVAVEVKTTLRQGDIDDHLVCMEKIRKYADEHGGKRQFIGAMAATIADDSSREYALKNSLFVLEPSRGEPSPLCGSVEDTGDDIKVTKAGWGSEGLVIIVETLKLQRSFL
jgi:hypothetical protein